MENKDNKKFNNDNKGFKGGFKGGKRDGKPFRKGRKEREKPEFEQKLVDLSRVNRVTKAGKQLAFRALVVLGDKKGRVGFGVSKGADVTIAVSKAVDQAKKTIITVNMVDGTVPHEIREKFKAARVMIKPAPKGTGIIAGGAVRTVLEMAGVPNASAKMIGKSTNKISNVKATFAALQSFKVRARSTAKSEVKPEAEKKETVKTEVKKVEKETETK